MLLVRFLCHKVGCDEFVYRMLFILDHSVVIKKHFGRRYVKTGGTLVIPLS